MSDEKYGLVAVKRDWVPEWLYAFVVNLFGHSIPCKWPIRQILNRELTVREQQGIDSIHEA